MALSPEDKQDVKNHMGKALANKVSKATRDRYASVSKRAKEQAKEREAKRSIGVPTSGSSPAAEGGRYTMSQPNGPGGERYTTGKNRSKGKRPAPKNDYVKAKKAWDNYEAAPKRRGHLTYVQRKRLNSDY